MDLSQTKQALISALQKAELEVLKSEGKHLELTYAYQIEIENEALFKLLHKGMVVAPFDSIDELCVFLKMDIDLNANTAH